VFPVCRAESANVDNRLPVGLQIVGAEFNDLTTIAFAKALQEEAGYNFIPTEGKIGGSASAL
jgi:Asp-tRNA(Asn)/Glu-tRNA(Gln) amidotransferase A subunit family amidase